MLDSRIGINIAASQLQHSSLFIKNVLRGKVIGGAGPSLSRASTHFNLRGQA